MKAGASLPKRTRPPWFVSRRLNSFSRTTLGKVKPDVFAPLQNSARFKRRSEFVSIYSSVPTAESEAGGFTSPSLGRFKSARGHGG